MGAFGGPAVSDQRSVALRHRLATVLLFEMGGRARTISMVKKKCQFTVTAPSDELALALHPDTRSMVVKNEKQVSGLEKLLCPIKELFQT
jgi:hypothetical protein